jgi:hypothetical protein
LAACTTAAKTPATKPAHQPPEAIGYNALISHNEARLYFPGSTVLESQVQVEGPDPCTPGAIGCGVHDLPASAETSLVVDGVPADRIYSWYAGELASLGWRLTGTDPISASRTYGRHSGESFTIEADIYSDYLHTSLPYNGTGMVYSIDYRFGTCPSPKAGCVLVGSSAPPSVPGDKSAAQAGPPVRPANYQELVSRFPANLYYTGGILMGSTAVAEGRNPQLGFDPAARAETSVVVRGESPASLAAWFAPRVALGGWQRVESVASAENTLAYVKPDGQGLQVTFGEVGGDLKGYGIQGSSYTLAYEIFPCHEAQTPCYLYPPKGSLVLDEHTDGEP